MLAYDKNDILLHCAVQIDLLVLDLEGAELQVLETLPWDKVRIR